MKGMRAQRGPAEHFRGRVAAFVDTLQWHGRNSFAGAELAAASPQTAVARRAALRRLQKQGRIFRPLPRHDFFVIVPSEYHLAGAPPCLQYLDALMQYLGVPTYYVGLLTAVQLYPVAMEVAGPGASGEVQVMVPKQLRSIQLGAERIHFFTKSSAAAAAVQWLELPRGAVRIGTPETTAVDLMTYVDGVGGLNPVVAALAALHRLMEPQALRAVLEREADIAVAQRLGCLLDIVASQTLTQPLANWLQGRHPRIRSLDVHAPDMDKDLHDRWRLRINTRFGGSTWTEPQSAGYVRR